MIDATRVFPGQVSPAPVAESLLFPSAQPALNSWRAHRRARLPLQKRPQVLGLLESMSHPGRDGDEILDGLPYFVALEVAGYLVEGLDSGYRVAAVRRRTCRESIAGMPDRHRADDLVEV